MDKLFIETLWKDINEVLINWKDWPHSWIRQIYSKISVLPILISELNHMVVLYIWVCFFLNIIFLWSIYVVRYSSSFLIFFAVYYFIILICHKLSIFPVDGYLKSFYFGAINILKLTCVWIYVCIFVTYIQGVDVLNNKLSIWSNLVTVTVKWS